MSEQKKILTAYSCGHEVELDEDEAVDMYADFAEGVPRECPDCAWPAWCGKGGHVGVPLAQWFAWETSAFQREEDEEKGLIASYPTITIYDGFSVGEGEEEIVRTVGVKMTSPGFARSLVVLDGEEGIVEGPRRRISSENATKYLARDVLRLVRDVHGFKTVNQLVKHGCKLLGEGDEEDEYDWL